MMQMHRFNRVALAAVALGVALTFLSSKLGHQDAMLAQSASDAGVAAVSVGRLQPGTPSESLAGAELSPADRDALYRRHLALREQAVALVDNQPASPAGLPAVVGVEAEFSDAPPEGEFHTPPSRNALVLGRNLRNPRANSGVGSSLAEPTAVNEGRRVLFTGNTHAEFSVDGGSTFPAAQNIALGAGPASAPFACCDLDSVYDKARGVTFWSVLFLNEAATQGTVRIFVRRQIQQANNCFYDITPGAGITPDYPHLGLGTNHLYLATNNVTAPSFLRVHRLNIDQMADCVPAAISTFTLTPAVGTRVVVPVDGARRTMYFAYHENLTQIRIFTWPDTAAAPSSVLRTINAHNHANPDCRGGSNNTDWIQRPTAFSITGFRVRGAVGASTIGWWWNVSADGAAGHNQGHVHAAIFTQSSLGLVAQPHIFSSTQCIGYPMVAANGRGDYGLSIAAGGRAGGRGPAVKGYVGLDDDFTAGTGNFGTLTLAAFGTHNPATLPGEDDPRWGDYTSVRAHQPCDLAFVATSYAHNGGTGVATLNARYIEFLRGRDNQCYTGWRDETRVP